MITAIVFVLIAIVLGIIFYLDVEFPTGLSSYFKREYYGQFGPLALCVELLVAGIYLFTGNKKVNFTLALFGFSVLMDFLFNVFGVFPSILPMYAKIMFLICAAWSFWLAFTDSFDLGRISFWGALMSFILGNIVELFFNFW
ncbi:hypothetical protein [Maribacter aurantiacus]|uniref:DoxX family protein n=1 Tax=Maribacter aurantiacus TaxID=1882343 RepID=A0A5R8MBT3_9FLAO|nr:hypothetical protein [Maribacter aurantiacus]TLF47003.1 hypothetical protein FEK29_04335 [Maribacter aurantiacus]